MVLPASWSRLSSALSPWHGFCSRLIVVALFLAPVILLLLSENSPVLHGEPHPGYPSSLEAPLQAPNTSSDSQRLETPAPAVRIPGWNCVLPYKQLPCASLRLVNFTTRPSVCIRHSVFYTLPDALVRASQHFDWSPTGDRDVCEGRSLFTVVGDDSVVAWTESQAVYESAIGYRIGLAVEPPAVSPELFAFFQKQWPKFDGVLSCVSEKKFAGHNLLPFTFGGTWVPQKDWNIYPKTERVSMLFSRKTDTDGHRFRHDIYRAIVSDPDLADKVQVFGTGAGRELTNKIDALRSFRFSIIIENTPEKYWITEKLIDAFATGTVPIYWGATEAEAPVRRYFDQGGIIFFNNVSELVAIIHSLRNQDYEDRFGAVQSNLELARRFVNPWDDVWEKYMRCPFEYYRREQIGCSA